jgi:hypothetical protein
LRVFFADELHGDAPGMRRAAMFPNVNALPGAQREAPIVERDAEIHRGQRGANVRGHIVIAFGGVNEEWVAVLHQAGEISLEVATDVGVGVLLDQQRGGSVPEVQRDQAAFEIIFPRPFGDFVREFVQAAPAGGDGDFAE